MRRVYNIDPDGLTDEAWAKLYKEYEYTETIKQRNLKRVFKSAITEALNEAFS